MESRLLTFFDHQFKHFFESLPQIYQYDSLQPTFPDEQFYFIKHLISTGSGVYYPLLYCFSTDPFSYQYLTQSATEYITLDRLDYSTKNCSGTFTSTLVTNVTSDSNSTASIINQFQLPGGFLTNYNAALLSPSPSNAYLCGLPDHVEYQFGCTMDSPSESYYISCQNFPDRIDLLLTLYDNSDCTPPDFYTYSISSANDRCNASSSSYYSCEQPATSPPPSLAPTPSPPPTFHPTSIYSPSPVQNYFVLGQYDLSLPFPSPSPSSTLSFSPSSSPSSSHTSSPLQLYCNSSDPSSLLSPSLAYYFPLDHCFQHNNTYAILLSTSLSSANLSSVSSVPILTLIASIYRGSCSSSLLFLGNLSLLSGSTSCSSLLTSPLPPSLNLSSSTSSSSSLPLPFPFPLPLSGLYSAAQIPSSSLPTSGIRTDFYPCSNTSPSFLSLCPSSHDCSLPFLSSIYRTDSPCFPLASSLSSSSSSSSQEISNQSVSFSCSDSSASYSLYNAQCVSSSLSSFQNSSLPPIPISSLSLPLPLPLSCPLNGSSLTCYDSSSPSHSSSSSLLLSLPTGALVGIAIGGLIVLACLALALHLLIRRLNPSVGLGRPKVSLSKLEPSSPSSSPSLSDSSSSSHFEMSRRV